MSSGSCKYSADSFCYVCGEFLKTRAKKYSVQTSRRMCEAYEAYFGMPVGDQDKKWTPHFSCEYCKRTLEGWYRGEKRAMRFAVPRIWRKPTDHTSDCYFCMVDPSKRRSGKNAQPVVYPDIPSSVAQVPHGSGFPVPTPPAAKQQLSSYERRESDSEGNVNAEFLDVVVDKAPYFPNQHDLNDLITDLGLTRSKAELLTSRLKQWNLLDESALCNFPEEIRNKFHCVLYP